MASYAVAHSNSSITLALEHWIRRDLRAKHDAALTEAVPSELLQLASSLAAGIITLNVASSQISR